MNCCQILAVILVNVLALPLQILALPFQLLFVLLMWEAQIEGVSRQSVVRRDGSVQFRRYRPVKEWSTKATGELLLGTQLEEASCSH